MSDNSSFLALKSNNIKDLISHLDTLVAWKQKELSAAKIYGIDIENYEIKSIQTKFKKLNILYHPDKLQQRGLEQKHIDKATEAIKIINQAKDYLIDLKKLQTSTFAANQAPVTPPEDTSDLQEKENSSLRDNPFFSVLDFLKVIVKPYAKLEYHHYKSTFFTSYCKDINYGKTLKPIANVFLLSILISLMLALFAFIFLVSASLYFVITGIKNLATPSQLKDTFETSFKRTCGSLAAITGCVFSLALGVMASLVISVNILSRLSTTFIKGYSENEIAPRPDLPLDFNLSSELTKRINAG